MHGPYDKKLMKRGEAARRLITEGEHPFRMLLEVVWPEHDWTESTMTTKRRQLLTIESLAAYAHDTA